MASRLPAFSLYQPPSRVKDFTLRFAQGLQVPPEAGSLTLQGIRLSIGRAQVSMRIRLRRKGMTTMNYQRIILVGNVTRDAERRTSQSGEVTYTAFGVGVSDGKDKTTFFPVLVFGK
jgi:hypothetical protein